MPTTVPNNYDSAAQMFYAAGRKAWAAGEPRENNASPTNPNNPNAWDQSYKNNPMLMGTNPSLPYGSCDVFWWVAYDDASYGWPDRGWKNAMAMSVYWPPINYDGTSATAGRLYQLVQLYTLGWRNFINSALTPPDPAAYPPLTAAEVSFEFARGKSDRSAGVMPPLVQYVDPATATTTTTPPPDTSTSEQEYPYAGYNWNAVLQYEQDGGSAGNTSLGGLNFGTGSSMSNIWPLLFLGR